MFKIYDTYTKKVKTFKPIKKGEVKYYSCGPTVYYSAHVGHLSTYVRTDMLKQYLKHWKNYKVKHIQNITDFGHMTSDEDAGIDKMKKAAEREHKSADEIADFYIKEFHEVIKEMNIEAPDIECRATKDVPAMIDFIKKILDRGYAYVKDGNVYFDTSKFKKYGKLSGKKLEEQEVQARLKEDPNKKSPFDFLLWASHKESHAHCWDSPWGKGMPGWHIECSAMSRKYLDGDFDIHSGAKDHYFPHHENEIAQNYGATGKVGVNYWVHFGLLTINGEKMSKSKGNFITAPDILKKHPPETIRMWIFASHYPNEFDYSEENINQAGFKVKKINEFIQRLYDITEKSNKPSKFADKYSKKFEKAMDADLNTPEAFAVLFEMILEANKKKLTFEDAQSIISFLKKVNLVFKIMNFKEETVQIPAEVKDLVMEREQARMGKDWATADRLRANIRNFGFEIVDTEQGPKVKKIQ